MQRADLIRAFSDEEGLSICEARRRLVLARWDKSVAKAQLRRDVIDLIIEDVVGMDERPAHVASQGVTIPATEYRELCGKAALWDEWQLDVKRWCATDGGE